MFLATHSAVPEVVSGLSVVRLSRSKTACTYNSYVCEAFALTNLFSQTKGLGYLSPSVIPSYNLV